MKVMLSMEKMTGRGSFDGYLIDKLFIYTKTKQFRYMQSLFCKLQGDETSMKVHGTRSRHLKCIA